MNAIILSSGSSCRMGKNKLTMMYNGKFIIENVIEEVISCKFTNVVLVAKDEEVLKCGKDIGIKCVKNINSDRGQSESMKLGISAIDNEEGFMFFCGDQPFIKKEFVINMVNEYLKDERFIIRPCHNGNPGMPVIFPYKFKKSLLNINGDIGGRHIIKSNMEWVKDIEIKDKMFMQDIDTIEDYNKYIGEELI